jgi:hypothetical protein
MSQPILEDFSGPVALAVRKFPWIAHSLIIYASPEDLRNKTNIIRLRCNVPLNLAYDNHYNAVLGTLSIMSDPENPLLRTCTIDDAGSTYQALFMLTHQFVSWANKKYKTDFEFDRTEYVSAKSFAEDVQYLEEEYIKCKDKDIKRANDICGFFDEFYFSTAPETEKENLNKCKQDNKKDEEITALNNSASSVAKPATSVAAAASAAITPAYTAATCTVGSLTVSKDEPGPKKASTALATK